MDLFHISPSKALAALQESKEEFALLFKHGSLSVEIYQPDKTDRQQPHEQDEIYVIIAGSGTFVLEDTSVRFAPGDFLFVPAGKTHRFVNFSEDFSTWVFFYGAKGGEEA